jgi:hypothetical protein
LYRVPIYIGLRDDHVKGRREKPGHIAAETSSLFHQVQRAIVRGELADQAEAARRVELTRARLTQLLDLTLLAPDIPERVLGLRAVAEVERASERSLRPVAAVTSWEEQRERFGVR